MSFKRRKSATGRGGMALVMAVMIVSVILVLGLMITFALFSEILSSGRTLSTTRALFAAEGGQEFGRLVLDDALQFFSVPASITASTLNSYANDAKSGNTSGDRDIRVLLEFCPNFQKFMPRGEMGVVSGKLGEGNNTVEYELAYDFWPTDVELPELSDPTGSYVFHYIYEITAQGTKTSGDEVTKQVTKLTGELEVRIFHPSFAFYDFFTINMTTAGGQQIYFANSETLDGPVYVRGKPGFAGNNAGGGPTFTDQFQTSWANWNTSARVYNPVVNWNQELPPLWAVDPIDTPGNSFSQERAALGNYAQVGETGNPVTHSERRNFLGLESGAMPPPAGVYYTQGDGSGDANSTDNLLGGIYIYGDVQQMDLGASGNHQIISILQNNQWTTIDIDNSAGTMTVTEPGQPPRTFNDVPNGVVYVEGTLNDLGRGNGYSAAIEEKTQMTIAAKNNMYVGNHINYEVDPRENPGAINVLGLVSGSGNVLVSDGAPSNLNIDASIFATANGKGFGVQNYASKPASGPLSVFGGLIMHSYQAIGTFTSAGLRNGYSKNFSYDQRFLNGAFSPPYFPTVQTYVGRLKSINRTDWGQVIPDEPAS